MPLPPQASQIHLFLPPPTSPPPQTPTHPRRIYIIYFITGNPGLIEYYRTFLTHLFFLLSPSQSHSSSDPKPTFHIYGRSLSGFETRSSAPTTPKPFAATPPPYSLAQQIAHAEAALEDVVERVRAHESSDDVRVLLAGHSVGAYIALELTRRQRAKADGVRIAGVIGLFPTVTHILRSDSGRKFGPLLTLPHLPRVIQYLAFLLSLLPHALLTALLHSLLSFPPPALHTTTAFLLSPHGVRQALHMAACEMRAIGPDAWDDEVWGAARPSAHAHARPVLRFLFAERDHWVGGAERDALIEARGVLVGEKEEEEEGEGVDGKGGERSEGDGEVDWKPRMEVDRSEGWEHGFCVWEGMSVGVAEKVYGYVLDIVERDGRGDERR